MCVVGDIRRDWEKGLWRCLRLGLGVVVRRFKVLMAGERIVSLVLRVVRFLY